LNFTYCHTDCLSRRVSGNNGGIRETANDHVEGFLHGSSKSDGRKPKSVIASKGRTVFDAASTTIIIVKRRSATTTVRSEEESSTLVRKERQLVSL